MKPTLPLLLVLLSSNIAQADKPNVCTTLEDTDLSRNIDLEPRGMQAPAVSEAIAFSSNIAFSRDRQKIALYQVSDSRQQATFKLFDSKTGKLLQSQTLDNYEERSHQTQLHFSPQEGIVYLNGMSYHAEDDTSSGAIPFWNLAGNEIIFSPCVTGMGVSTVQFSDDETVAFSTTVDSFNSLCSTQEAKLLETKGQGGELQGEAGKQQTSIQLYDVESQQARPLQTADLFLYSELVEPAGGAPEYQTVSYDEAIKQASFCRLPLVATNLTKNNNIRLSITGADLDLKNTPTDNCKSAL